MSERNREAAPTPGPKDRTFAIFAISVLSLFLELLLIRWVGTEVRIFAYLQNTVLVVCFLGLGLGSFSSRHPVRMAHSLVPLLILVALLAAPPTRALLAGISDDLSVIGDPLIWSASHGTGWHKVADVSLGLSLSVVLLGLVGASFVPLGRVLGRLLDEHPRPILAYSLNVAGSLIGTWLLVALSLWHLSPAWWFACVALLSLPFLSRGRLHWGEGALLVGLVAAAVVASHTPGAVESVWSPYQKLVLEKQPPDGIGEYVVHVNNIGYQAILNLDPKHVAAHPEHYAPAWAGLSPYDIPLLFHPKPRRVLIVGAGTGNDAAAALRNGAEDVTAVEIDPVILDMGRRYHPEHPYDDPRVHVVIDDARSFFATSHQKFDLIVFGLLDAHTTTSMTNARLDHYVYTKQSLMEARSLLAKGGVVVMSFAVQRQFIGDRIARTLHEVFGEAPLSFVVPLSAYGWGGTMFVSGDLGQVRKALQTNPRLAGAVAAWQRANPRRWSNTVPVSTDDWPYLYLPHPEIPVLYLLLAGLLVVLFLLGSRLCGTPGLVVGWQRSHWHFFFLGAAFLLLEVQNISKASLILGNTWWVNSVIISGVLVMVLLANAVAARFPNLPVSLVYVGLIGSCLGLYFFDLRMLETLPYTSKALVVGGLTTLPMFFSGIVFVRSFAMAAHKDEALGANLGGALVGGLLQSITFVTGVKALLLVVAAFYGIVFLTRPGVEERAAREVAAAPSH